MSKKQLSLRELDFNNIGQWPQNAKIGLCAFIALVILLLAWLLFVRDKRTELEGLQGQETELRTEFETKQGRAANLEPLKQQLAQMEQQLQQMLRQLPSKTEMPDLIVDISQTALATGIANELFQPGAETAQEFYAEKPIELKMVGTYHQFGAFVSGVASLPRVVIMTMHDISLKPREVSGADKGKKPASIGPGTVLELKGTVKTYRYRDPNEDLEGGDTTTANGGKPATAPGTPPVPGAAAVTSGVQNTQAAANKAGGSR